MLWPDEIIHLTFFVYVQIVELAIPLVPNSDDSIMLWGASYLARIVKLIWVVHEMYKDKDRSIVKKIEVWVEVHCKVGQGNLKLNPIENH